MIDGSASNWQRGTNAAARYIEGIEAFYGCSVRRVASRLRKAADSGPNSFQSTRFDDFLDTYCEQVVEVQQGLTALPTLPSAMARNKAVPITPPPQSQFKGWPILDPGETRPLVMLRVGDFSPWGPRYPAGDAKTVLLYSHQVVLMDSSLSLSRFWIANSAKFLASPALRKDEEALLDLNSRGLLRKHYLHEPPAPEGMAREEWLTRVVEQYADLREAISRGYVESLFVDPSSKWSSWRPGEEYVRLWEEENNMKRDRALIDESSKGILLAISVAAANPGFANVVASPGFQEALVNHFRPVLEEKRKRTRTNSAVPNALDRHMISRLFELNLDGIDFARVKDLVSVRDSEAFSGVRSTIREAVAAAESQRVLADAQAAAREVIRDHAGKDRSGLGKSLSRVTIPKSVAFAVGGWAALDAQTWQPLLPLATQLAIDVGRDLHQQRALKAQRSLYIALSREKSG